MGRILLIFTLVQSATSNCYPPTESVDHFQILSENTVETKRGFEVLCDDLTECTGFSFRDTGLQSPCSLLGAANQSEICSLPVMIYPKQTTGFQARSSLTAELGNDPCVEEIFPTEIRLDTYRICTHDTSKIYVIRFTGLWNDVGRRITLDNGRRNKLYFNKTTGMWLFLYNEQNVNFRRNAVAAVCATAGGVKCPCGKLRHSWLPSPTTYDVTTGQINPCDNRNTKARYCAKRACGCGGFPRMPTT